MSRAGVSVDYAERCLGHVMGAVRSTYDRFEYREEKRAAFEALAALMEDIVDPRGAAKRAAAREAAEEAPINVTKLSSLRRARG
jgi:hypothetical protein